MIYVVSDINGDYEKYKRLLQTIQFRGEDLLYVLGNIVDYGEESMELIGDLSIRCNVIPIVGDRDLRAVKMLMKFEKMLSTGNEKPDSDYILQMSEWVKDGGQTTLEGFRALDSEMREGVIDYLSDMSLYEIAEAGGKKYLLVHSGIAGFKPGMTEDDLAELEPEAFVSEPLDLSRKYFDDMTVVVGHTSTLDGGDGKIYHGNGSIAINCGVRDGGALACLCLDNGREYYIK